MARSLANELVAMDSNFSQPRKKGYTQCSTKDQKNMANNYKVHLWAQVLLVISAKVRFGYQLKGPSFHPQHYSSYMRWSISSNTDTLSLLMGSHHRQIAILVPDDKLDCFEILPKKFDSAKTVQLFIWDQYCHLGLIAPHWFERPWKTKVLEGQRNSTSLYFKSTWQFHFR